MKKVSAAIHNTYQTLLTHYGAQKWWPAESPFEVLVGAILTQNTNWSNVEKAIIRLKEANAMQPEILLAMDEEKLAQLIRPSGYFRLKAKRLRHFLYWLNQPDQNHRIQGLDDDTLRRELLAINGIGPETADDMLLYGFDRPSFVIDTYTRRIFVRMGIFNEQMAKSYERLRATFQQVLEDETGRVTIYKEYHALIVTHAKEFCRKTPQCEGCPLKINCQYGRQKTYE